ncbi:60S ribosomal protein L32 [Candida albicans SC5314]|nr:60S ribosomal protein L32 [Candida albicans P37037]KHC73312.1 60S ribosomal protein L32 [Candida albicans SC5314]KHC82575.1 60S ribosomal protein L32 [Candida albicans SC5314]
MSCYCTLNLMSSKLPLSSHLEKELKSLLKLRNSVLKSLIQRVN